MKTSGSRRSTNIVDYRETPFLLQPESLTPEEQRAQLVEAQREEQHRQRVEAGFILGGLVLFVLWKAVRRG